MDDNFMTIVFDRNIEATEFLLNTILERTDMKVIKVVAQREYKSPITGGRSQVCKAVEEFSEKIAVERANLTGLTLLEVQDLQKTL